MAKKVLSVLLAVVMIAALCTVAFVSASADEEEYATVTYGSETYTIKVGDTFTVKKSVVLPSGYSVQGGKFTVYYDPTVLEPQKVEVDQYGTKGYALTDLAGVTSAPGLTTDGNGVSVAFAATQYSLANFLTASRDNFATFTLKVIAAGETTITEVFDLGLFAEDNETSTISVITDSVPVEGQEELAAQVTSAGGASGGATLISAPSYEEPTDATDASSDATDASSDATDASSDATDASSDANSTTATEATSSTDSTSPATGEAAASVFVTLAVLAMAAAVVVAARKRATK